MTPQEVAQSVIELIETHPDSWRQRTWGYPVEDVTNPCGTQCCIAGWTVNIVHGEELRNAPTQDDYGDRMSLGEAVIEVFDRSITEVAGRALGLDDNTSSKLFFCYDHVHALDMLKLIADCEPGKEVDVVLNYKRKDANDEQV
ncbi:MAG: hypothetical protein BWY17_05281 [Deltaproteobacteria bacterium ADurb.Bin207]|nr:MAG: hypothetical protein BWY17_05281 [Deltaproteobacteria bacterium ADurb.Bin207]